MIWSSFHSKVYTQGKWKDIIIKNLHTNVHSIIIYNSQKDGNNPNIINQWTKCCTSTKHFNLVLAHDKVKVKVTQSCPTLCDSMDYTVHWILQARILEWVFSRGSFQSRDQTQISNIAGKFFRDQTRPGAFRVV